MFQRANKLAASIAWTGAITSFGLAFISYVGFLQFGGPTLGTVGGVIAVLLASQYITSYLLMQVPKMIWDQEEEHPDQPPTPWDSQRELMRASYQDVPPTPVVTTNSLMYAALIMEEGGETFTALAEALRRHLATIDANPNYERAVSGVQQQLASQGRILQMVSVIIRKSLEELDINFPMAPEDAIELLDGATDLAVVNCGFALASGLPGQEGYAEVVGSNLSKIDPHARIILKTPDGKWIKGPNYYKPDLAKVLGHK